MASSSRPTEWEKDSTYFIQGKITLPAPTKPQQPLPPPTPNHRSAAVVFTDDSEVEWWRDLRTGRIVPEVLPAEALRLVIRNFWSSDVVGIEMDEVQSSEWTSTHESLKRHLMGLMAEYHDQVEDIMHKIWDVTQEAYPNLVSPAGRPPLPRFPSAAAAMMPKFSGWIRRSAEESIVGDKVIMSHKWGQGNESVADLTKPELSSFLAAFENHMPESTTFRPADDDSVRAMAEQCAKACGKISPMERRQ